MALQLSPIKAPCLLVLSATKDGRGPGTQAHMGLGEKGTITLTLDLFALFCFAWGLTCCVDGQGSADPTRVASSPSAHQLHAFSAVGRATARTSPTWHRRQRKHRSRCRSALSKRRGSTPVTSPALVGARFTETRGRDTASPSEPVRRDRPRTPRPEPYGPDKAQRSRTKTTRRQPRSARS